MNFEKFIGRNDINKNYHEVLKYENDITQERSYKRTEIENSESNDSTKSDISDISGKYKGLYSLRDLDFLHTSCDIEKITNNDIFRLFRKNYISDKSRKYNKSEPILLFSGPVIKSIVDPFYTNTTNTSNTNSCPKVRNEIIVTVVSDLSVLECLNHIKKSNQVNDNKINNYDPRLYYQICIENYDFFIKKKSYQSVSEAVLSSKNQLDRITLVDSDIYVSGLFILEFHNKIQTYDRTRLDHVFGYPIDLLNIYDRDECISLKHNNGLFKSIVDRADCSVLANVLAEYNTYIGNNNSNELDKVDKLEINVERVMIIESQQKYSVLEYLIMKMVTTNHVVILQAYRNMFMMLVSNNYKFIRPPHIFAKVINFDNKFPSLYMILENGSTKHPIKIVDMGFIKEHCISSMYHIDMFLIKKFIQSDSEEMFVDYITRIKLVKKLSIHGSKTGRMIIDWLVTYNPNKIITTLIDTKTLIRSDIFRIIFLTQNFDLLEQFEKSIIDYVKYKDQLDQQKQFTDKHNKVIDMMNNIEDEHIIECDEMNNESQIKEDDELDEDFDKKSDELSNESNKSELSNESNVSNVSNISNESNLSNESNKNSENSEKIIDPDDILIILNTLKDVIKNGLSNSFFLIYQICPNILDDDYLRTIYKTKSNDCNTNVIHWIETDESLEILQLICKFRPDIVNIRDKRGLTPLLAITKDYNEDTNTSIENIIVHLLANGADYDDTDENGDTILHILIRKGNKKLVNTILRLVPSIINNQNMDMMTPVMLAAISGNESMVYALEGCNADNTYKDKQGNLVYHYICSKGICPGSIVINEPNYFGFRPSDYSIYCDDFYYFR
jgi:hypothetical protein